MSLLEPQSQNGPASPGSPGEHESQAQPSQRRPDWRQFRGAYGLIGFTVLVFAGQWLSLSLAGTDLLLEWGAKSRPEMIAGQVWRFVTPIFLHVSLPHLLVNMYSLYAIGPAVERFFGTPRFIAVYMLSGISGVLFSLALSPYPSAGASGSIFGLLGALAAFLYLHRTLFGRFGRLQLRQLVLVAVLNLALGLMPGIDNWGHVGGLLAGVMLTWAIGPAYRVVWVTAEQGQLADQRPWREVRASTLLAAGVLSALALIALTLPPL
jgi:rhomboid protease GluP